MPKGHKTCPKCQADCLAISKQCSSCHTDFVPKHPPKIKQIKQAPIKNLDRPVKYESPRGMDNRNGRLFPMEYETYRIFSITYVPAGAAPVNLKKNPTEEDVIRWADDVRKFFLEKSGEWLLNHALAYYMRYGYELENEEAERICLLINQLPDVQNPSEE